MLFVLIVSLAASVIRWSVAGQEVNFASQAFIGFARLVCASLVLIGIGNTGLLLIRRYLGKESLQGAYLLGNRLSDLLGALFLGQSICLVWIALRSGASAVIALLSGLIAPITSAEVALCTLLALLIPVISAYQKGSNASKEREAFGVKAVIPYVYLFLILTLTYLPIALRELPRTVALSSDPDQHAFWAFQIVRLGLIPWDQGLIGQGPFEYPAGFAALNAVWITFSGLSAVEVVTIQPAIQFFLAGFLWASFLHPLLGRFATNLKSTFGDSITCISALATICMYWYLAPYGLEQQRFHSEGTARLSIPPLISVSVFCWLLSPRALGSGQLSTLRLLGAWLAAAVVALFNPISCVIPGVIALAVSVPTLLRLLTRGARFSRAAPFQQLVFICVGCVVLVLCDPYFVNIIKHALHSLLHGAIFSASNAAGPPTADTAGGGVLSVLLAIITHPNVPDSTVVSHLLSGGVYSGERVSPFIAWTLIAVACVSLVCGSGMARRFACLLGFLGVCSCLNLELSALSSRHFPAFLVQSYFLNAVLQVGAVLGVGVCALVVAFLLTQTVLHRLALLALALLILTSRTSFAHENPAYRLMPRFNYCGPLGCVVDEDQEALRFLSELGANLLEKYPGLDYKRAPKLLIVNGVAPGAVENWLFPGGVSRLTPMFWPLPVAFFYFRGSHLWSYENYLAHVCFTWDIQWLRSHNVRYLLALDGDPGCLKNKQEVLGQLKVIYRNPRVAVYEIF
jgi:hypothetical protein